MSLQVGSSDCAPPHVVLTQFSITIIEARWA